MPRDAVRFFGVNDAEERDRSAPLMAVYFCSPAHATDTDLVASLIEDSIVIAPLVSSLASVSDEVPPQLRHVNALERGEADAGVGRLTTLILETFRLLRRERRLFISYRRADAQPFAERLYDALDARGFDVFIDIRSVPPAADFQAELWHRMSDSDVVVLVDTPGFRSSRWTTAELARANATNIQILHVLWPGQMEDATSAFSHFVKVARRDFWGPFLWRGRSVRQSLLTKLCNEAEQLRARAIAARYRYLVDNFCDAARDVGLNPAVQPEQWVLIDEIGGKKLAVVPAIGVPTSNRINDIFDAVAERGLNAEDVWVIYDNRGVLNTWLSHLDWLDSHLPIRTVRMSQAPGLLRGLL